MMTLFNMFLIARKKAVFLYSIIKRSSGHFFHARNTLTAVNCVLDYTADRL